MFNIIFKKNSFNYSFILLKMVQSSNYIEFLISNKINKIASICLKQRG